MVGWHHPGFNWFGESTSHVCRCLDPKQYLRNPPFANIWFQLWDWGMKAVSILVKCGTVQMLCAVSFLLFKIFASNTAGTFGVIAIVLYAITGTTLLCLSCHPKNLFLVLSANIFTLLALLGASGLTVIAVVTIHYDPTHNNQQVNQQAIVLLVNSLVMLSATLASTSKICWLWFCTSDTATDSR